VNLETFFEKFDLFADCPNAVQKMRELILELAVQGKLVEQREEDSLPCAVSNKAICADVPFEVPASWIWTRLSALGDTKPRNTCDDSLKYSFVPMTFIPAGFGWDVRSEQRLWGDIKKGYTHFQDNDVVMAKITPCFENGKSAVMAGLYGGCGAGTTELHVFRPEIQDVYSRYVLIYLKTRGFIDRGVPRMTGSAGQKRVPHDYFANSPLPLPPLAEQKRIVAKVDELMALCDALEAQQKERETKRAALAKAALAAFAEAPSPQSLELLFHPSYAIDPSDLRKSILTLAVQGKLVEQREEEGDADSLIAAISNQRKSINAKNYSQVSEDEWFFDVPESWRWIRMGNISLQSDSGWSPQCLAESRVGNAWGVLKVSAVSWGVFDPEANKALPSGMEIRDDCEVKDGDFLLSRANTEELVARSVVVGRTPPHLMMSDKIVRFQFPSEIEKGYINLVNSSAPAREYYARNASGTSSSMKNVGRKVMCELPVPLPPLAEQKRIVAKVDELMVLVDRLDAKVKAAQETGARLLEAMVAELSGKVAGTGVSR